MSLTEQAQLAYRNYVTNGVPASGAHEPVKAEIIPLFSVIDQALSSIGMAGSVTVVKSSKSLLLADLAHNANTIALVYADAVPEQNDFYVKTGSSGSGTWNALGLLITPALAANIAEAVEAYADIEANLATSQAAAAQAVSAAETAENASDTAESFANAAGISKVYDTKAAATADLAGIAANAYIQVLVDESLGNDTTIYRKESGSLVYKLTLNLNAIRRSQIASVKWRIEAGFTDPIWDNVLTVVNQSSYPVADPGDGRTHNVGNAAITFRSADMWEQGAFGYSALKLGEWVDHPTYGSSYHPNCVYWTSNDLSSGNTDYGAPDIFIGVDILPGAMYNGAPNPFAGGGTFKCFEHRANSGETFIRARNTAPGYLGTVGFEANVNLGLAGNPVGIQMTTSSTDSFFYIREYSEVDFFGLAANIDAAYNLKNNAKSGWLVNFGHGIGSDCFKVGRKAAGGSGAPVDLFKVTNNGALIVPEIAAASVATPPAGYQALFFDVSDHLLKRKNSSGTVTAI